MTRSVHFRKTSEQIRDWHYILIEIGGMHMASGVVLVLIKSGNIFTADLLIWSVGIHIVSKWRKI
mgnify:CR=1 FL=1